MHPAKRKKGNEAKIHQKAKLKYQEQLKGREEKVGTIISMTYPSFWSQQTFFL